MTRLAYVELHCASTSAYQRNVAWYRDALGLAVAEDGAPHRWTAFETGAARLALVGHDVGTLEHGVGEPNVVTNLEVDDLDAAVALAAEHGARPFETRDVGAEVLGGPYRTVAFRDPDGRRVQLVSRH